jgi:hypothetical protein
MLPHPAKAKKRLNRLVPVIFMKTAHGLVSIRRFLSIRSITERGIDVRRATRGGWEWRGRIAGFSLRHIR